MRLFAIVPAAGLSRRMGQPKLVMDLLGKPVAKRLLETLDQPGIEATVVVIRRSDAMLQNCIGSTQAIPVLPPVDPPDMRASVEAGLAFIEKRFHPDEEDGWLLIPADHPILDPAALREILAAWQECTEDVLIPTHNGRRGHPTVFRWRLAAQVPAIPENRGINWLLKNEDVSRSELPSASPGILLDLDTPEDFRALVRKMSASPDSLP